MSNAITNAFVEQYSANVNHIAQQKAWTFEGKVDVRPIKGKTSYFNLLGKSTARKVTTRNGVSTPQNTDHLVRALTCLPYDSIEWLDENDDLSLLIEPTSAYAKAQAMAMNRAKTEVVINAALGTSYTGVYGATAVPLPVGQQIAVNYVPSGAPANSGLTLGKLIEAKERIMSADAYDYDDEIYFVCSFKQIADLLNNVNAVSSADYNNVKALYDGTVTYFMGMNFLISNLVPLNGSGYQQAFTYLKSGLIFGEQQGIKSMVDVLPNQSHTVQVRTIGMWGATRTEEEKVVEVICAV